MVKLTARQKEKLVTHSKRHTTTHVNKMASLMRKGSSFSDAHKKVTRNEVKSKQKQKQTQIQRVVINLGSQKGGKGGGTRKPRATTQGGSSQVLAEFASMAPPAPPLNTFTPTPFAQPQATPMRAAVPTSTPVTLPVPTFARPPSVRTESLRGPAPLETPVLGRAKSLEEEYGEVAKATKAFEERQAALAANPPPEVANVMEAIASAEARAAPPPPPAEAAEAAEPAKPRRGRPAGKKDSKPRRKVARAMDAQKMMTPVEAQAVPTFDEDPAGFDVTPQMRIQPETLKMRDALIADPQGFPAFPFVGDVAM